MNNRQRAVYASLSTHEYTPAMIFKERIPEEIVPAGEIFTVLTELKEMGLAELVYGQGWRAVESAESHVNEEAAAMRAAWGQEVDSGLTVLGFSDWVFNKALASGMFDEEIAQDDDEEDLEEEEGDLNWQRGNWAAAGLQAYLDARQGMDPGLGDTYGDEGSDEFEEGFRDLLCDLMHLAYRADVDFQRMLDMAEVNYAADMRDDEEDDERDET